MVCWWKIRVNSLWNCISPQPRCHRVSPNPFIVELVDFNINIILVEPGAIRSNFMDNIKTVKGFHSNKSPYAKTVQQMFQGLESFFASSSHPVDVAQVILNVVNSPSPELRYPVGKDAESIFKARTELSDRDLEKWVRESYMEKKGFVQLMIPCR